MGVRPLERLENRLLLATGGLDTTFGVLDPITGLRSGRATIATISQSRGPAATPLMTRFGS